MNPDWNIVVLIVIAVVLIAVDFYVPGFVLGSIGAVLMVIALGLCWSRHGVTWAAGLFLLEAGIAFGATYISIKVIPQTKLGQRMILSHDQTNLRAATDQRADLVGQTGTAHTSLRPSGTVIVAGQRLDVLAEAGIIERGATIQIVAVDGPRVIVKKV